MAQTCLEAYGAIRHEGRLSDRALEFTLRSKRHLYSNERRVVAERVYSLLRHQLLVDFLAAKAFRGFDKQGTTPTSRARPAKTCCGWPFHKYSTETRRRAWGGRCH